MTAKASPGPTAIVEEFSYRSVPDFPRPAWDGLSIEELSRGADGAILPRPGSLPQPQSAPTVAVFEQRLTEECARSFEAGRGRGLEEGRAAERATRDALQEGFEAASQSAHRQLVEQAARLVENFAREQALCLEALEPQAVRLALAIAARVLRHEAQMDPLLLTGAVRVALGQIPASARIRLLVPPADLELWTEAIALLPNLPVKPAVAAREVMQLGDCSLDTDLGSADLGIAAQLLEIERILLNRAVYAADVPKERGQMTALDEEEEQ
jgi:flagellar assembly protein FliH